MHFFFLKDLDMPLQYNVRKMQQWLFSQTIPINTWHLLTSDYEDAMFLLNCIVDVVNLYVGIKLLM